MKTEDVIGFCGLGIVGFCFVGWIITFVQAFDWVSPFAWVPWLVGCWVGAFLVGMAAIIQNSR